MRFLCSILLTAFSAVAAFGSDSPAGIPGRAWEDAPAFSATLQEGSAVAALKQVAAAEAGEFRVSEDGTRFLTLRFVNSGASASRVHLRDMHLPQGARVFVYGVENGAVTDVAGPYTEGVGVDGDLWTAAVRGSQLVLELQDDNGVVADLPFAVTEMAAVDATDAGKESVARVEGELRTSLFRGMAVTHGVADGLAVFEGDIVLGKAAEMAPATGSKNSNRAAVAITGSYYRWPGGVLPYAIDPTMPATNRITDAIAHWNTKLAGYVKIVPRTTESAYVYFNHSANAGQCASSVGRQGYAQDLFVGDYCNTGNMIHEIGHAFGLWHEQSREDRNTYVKVNFENIATSSAYNFNQNITDGDDINAYDYGSIMHYNAYAFSSNGLPTIETIPAGIPIGQRDGLSTGDIAAIRLLYPPAPVNVSAPSTVAYTITSNPAGIPLMVDGKSYTSATTFNWTPGSSHTIAALAPAAANGVKYTFTSWSDNGAMFHMVPAGTSAKTITATYAVSYQLTTGTTGSGTVAVAPASADAFYASSSAVNVTAVPASGSCFTGWTNLIGNATPLAKVSMTQAYNVVAKFQPGSVIASPATLNAAGAGSTQMITVLANTGCQWTFNSPVTWIRLRSVPPTNTSANLLLSVDANTTGVARTAVISFGPATITVVQPAR